MALESERIESAVRNTPASRYVSSGGLRLHYLEWGDPQAPLLLLLHGGSAHAHWWDFFADAMAHEYRLVALDLRGHGDSERPTPPRYGLEDYVGDVRSLVAEIDPPRLSIIGHSMGGLVATAFAAGSAVPVDAVVLVDIRVRGSENGRRFLVRLGSLPHPVYPSREDAIRRFRLLPSEHGADPAVLRHMATHGLRDLPDGRTTPKFDRAALSEATALDLSETLARLSCPILCIRGAHSTLVPPAALDEVKKVLPRAETAEIPDAYHHVMLDNPAEFERVVREFLQRV